MLQRDKLNVQLVPFQMHLKICVVEYEKHWALSTELSEHCIHSRAFASKYDQMSLKWRLSAVKCHMLRLTKEADRKRHDTPLPTPRPTLIPIFVAAPQQFSWLGFGSPFFLLYKYLPHTNWVFIVSFFFIVTNPIPWLGVSLGTAPKLIHLRDGLPPSNSEQTPLPGSILLFWPLRKFGSIEVSGSVFNLLWFFS